MNAIAEQTYKRIDNHLYNTQGDSWWQENAVLYFLKTGLNPCRFPYFLNAYTQQLKMSAVDKTALDIGCGGGILAEEFAAAGFKVTGIDPSEASLETAKNHANYSGLDIEYQTGTGENLSFPDNSFDVVYCCDVLEHVRDLPKCMSEIARVLKPGGVFFYDTINRTFQSKLIAIKIMQEWQWTAFMPPNLHVYDMFIKPKELDALMKSNGLQPKDVKGMSPGVNPFEIISLCRQRIKGEITYGEMGRRIRFRESNDLSMSYMGFAIKNSIN